VTLPVEGLGEGDVDEGVEGGVDGGGSGGGVVTTGVGDCNKLAIAGFCSKFKADREPPDEEGKPLPAEAIGWLAPTTGERVATAALVVDVALERGGVVNFVMEAAASVVEVVVVSAVVGVTCPYVMPDVVAGAIGVDVVGAAVEAMAGRLVNVRCGDNGISGRRTEFLDGSIGLVMPVASVLRDCRTVPWVGGIRSVDSLAERWIRLWRRGASCSAATMIVGIDRVCNSIAARTACWILNIRKPLTGSFLVGHT
jgi:hypothetical protein